MNIASNYDQNNENEYVNEYVSQDSSDLEESNPSSESENSDIDDISSSGSSSSENNDIEDTSNTTAYNDNNDNKLGYNLINDVNNGRFLNDTKVDVYEYNRNNMFTKDIEKQSLLIDSKNMHYNDETRKYKYVIEFDSSNTKTGLDIYKNIIGFRLLNATLKSNPYVINSMNNFIWINIGGTYNILTDTINGGSTIKITFPPRSFNSEPTIAAYMQLQLNAILTGFTITYDNNIHSTGVEGTYKYTFNNSASSFIFDFKKSFDDGSSIYRLLGFHKKIYYTPQNIDLISEYVGDMSTHYIDIVVPQIPYIACKKNIDRKHIIERVPISVPQGCMINYNNSLIIDNESNNYFYPITLNKLEIELYSDSSNVMYNAEYADNSFEFQIILLINLNLLK